MSCHNLVLRAGEQFSYQLLNPESPGILKATEYSREQAGDEREIHLSLKLESLITEMGEILPNSGVNQKPSFNWRDFGNGNYQPVKRTIWEMMGK